MDSHSALEVGHLREGTRSFEVRRPKCEEGSSVSLWRIACGGFQLGRSTAVGGAQSFEKKKIGERPNRLLVVQIGDSTSQAEVFKAHVVSQGVCV